MFGYLWANREAILPMRCARQRREVLTAGELYGCYDVNQTVFFPERSKRLFSFSIMLDNDCCAVEILLRNSGTDKRISKRSRNTRESEN